jgi:hypothetical protein
MEYMTGGSSPPVVQGQELSTERGVGPARQWRRGRCGATRPLDVCRISGRPFYGAMGAGDIVTVANPSRAIQGDRVARLLYDVVGTTPRETRDDGPVAWAPARA